MRWWLAVVVLAAACDGGGTGDPGGVTCTYEGRTYHENETWLASDDCNTCHCFDTGSFGCTLVACADPEPPAASCAASTACGNGPACAAGERCINGACVCGERRVLCGDQATCGGAAGADACGSECSPGAGE